LKNGLVSMAKKAYPTIKKILKDFVKDEEGIISKENLLKAGLAIGGLIALSQMVGATHVDTKSVMTVTYYPGTDEAHAEHSNHSQACPHKYGKASYAAQDCPDIGY